jgi:signal transduction histidine kinase/CheY-like chemotaxis protein
MNSRRASSDALIAWLVGITFVIVTALAGTYVWRMSRMADRSRFLSAVEGVRSSIDYRFDTYINILRAAGGLFTAESNPSPTELREFIQHIDVQRRYPGIQGIGFSLRIGPADAAAVTARVRESEYADFRIWPDTPREEMHSIVLIEPFDARNRLALGYDMSTDPVRRVAMERARDSGEPAASGPVTLVQEVGSEKQAGFLIYVPVYSSGQVPATIAERRRQLTGYIFAPFRAEDLLSTLVAQRRPEVDFDVSDGQRQLFLSGEPVANPRFTTQRRVTVGGRSWNVRFRSRRSSGGAPLFLTFWTVLGGLLISFLLFALIRLQMKGRAQAEETAEALLASQRDLEQASRAKDEFLATLSHELRTPMTAIIGWSKMMAASDLEPETLGVAIDAIQQSSRTQAQLIDDLLDVSRITAGKMRIEKRPLDLRNVIRIAVDTVTPVAEAKRVTLESQIGDASIHVSGDPQRLQQVAMNLMTNAVKFTPSGGKVTVELKSEGSRAVLIVTDTGQGIDAEFLPHVFERFRQADSTTTRSHTGLGLGLAIVHHLVELHGGSVTAHSDGPGHGARFRMTLPLLKGVTSIAEETADRTSSGALLAGTHILVVDDEENVRNYLATVFRRNHADVRAAASAREALAIVAEWPPDVIITDLGMPEIDGYGLFERIRAISALDRVPVIALTAYARAEDRDRVEKAGFDLYVTKPIEPVALLRVVAGAIRDRMTKG